MARKSTICEACGYASWNGRVCKGCLKFYGPPAENAIAGSALARRMAKCVTFEDTIQALSELCDYMVHWPMTDMVPLVHTKKNMSAGEISPADMKNKAPLTE